MSGGLNLTPELIGQFCSIYLTRDQQLFVARISRAKPDAVARLSANHPDEFSSAKPVAEWWLEVCRDAHRVGAA